MSLLEYYPFLAEAITFEMRLTSCPHVVQRFSSSFNVSFLPLLTTVGRKSKTFCLVTIDRNMFCLIIFQLKLVIANKRDIHKLNETDFTTNVNMNSAHAASQAPEPKTVAEML